MNRRQRVLVLFAALVVAFFFHIYFCKWMTGTDPGAAFLRLRHVKLLGSQYKAIKLQDLRTDVRDVLSGPGSDLIKAVRLEALSNEIDSVKSLKDTDQFDGVFGLYPNPGLGSSGHTPAKRVAFYFGIITPFVILCLGAFIALGTPRRKVQA